MIQKFSKSMFCVAAALLMFNTCTQDNGTSPYDCSKTKAVILLKSSNKSVISDVAIKDTVGDSIYCGFYSNLIMNIDSVEIRKVSASDNTGDIIFTFKNIQSLKNSDTIWNSLVLSDTGTITITGTAFLNCNKQLSATATVTILSRPTNNQPKLIVTSQVSMHPGETCTLMVAASDIDTFQVLTFSTVKAPATSSFNLQSRIFMWQAPTDFVGTDSVVFKVQDNGYPPLSDQKTVYLNVQASSVNNKPVLAVKGVRNINPGDSCILKLKATDPDSLQTVTISMLSGPKGSVLKDSIFTWVAPETFTGKDSAIFIAKDNGLPPKSDTVMVYISVSSNIPLPSRPDSLKIVSRTSGLVTLQWHYSSAADFYTLFRASSSHTTTFKAIDTVYDTLCKDSVGTLNCKYYIKAYNNSGESPSSDTVVSLYSNQPPKWQYDTINEVFAVGQTLTLTLSNMCSDPNGYPITYSLVSGKPTGDTIKAGVYSFTPAASDTGVSWPRIVAKNSAGLTDTVTLHLTVTAVDRQAPYLKLFSPATDSTIVETNKQTVKVICKDPSGVASVKCSMGTDTFSLSNTDSIYSATVTGLKSTGMNEILFIATDASVNANKDTLKVHIKYTPLVTDSVGPVITLVTPAKDSATTNSSSYTFKVMCKDPSGVASLKCSMGTDTFSVSNTDSIYSATVSGLKSTGMNEILFIAIDSSVTANRDTLKVHIKYTPLLTDSVGPDITMVTPAKDSTSTNSSSYAVKLTCTDTSGVLSVNGVLGTTAFTGVRGTGNNWTITVNGLTANVFNTIIFTATDSSLRANKTMDTLYIKYDPTMLDSIAPTIVQKSGPASGSFISDPLVTIVDTIYDPSGVDSVYWKLNNGSVKLLTKANGKYSLTDSVKREKLDTIVVIAIDSSTRRNRDTQIVILNYIIAPKITTQPVSKAVCSGSQAIFSVAATGTSPLSYQWRTGAASFTDITGATNPACTLSNVTSAQTILSCVVSNQSTASATSNLCTLTVNQPPTISNPLATSICFGNSGATMTVTASSGATLQWFKGSPVGTHTSLTNNSNYSGVDAATLTFNQ